MSSKENEEEAAVIPKEMRTLYESCGHGQVFRFVDGGKGSTKRLLSQLAEIDPKRVNRLFQASMADIRASELSGGDVDLKPCETMQVLAEAKSSEVAGWAKTGLKAIAENKVAVIIMAGGQGTRLGFNRPKGEYDIKLPSGKCIFRLQAERILKLEKLAATGTDDGKDCRIMLYIMTSPMTHEQTLEGWEKSNYHGMKKENVFFFRQGTLPCLTKEGKIMMESADKVAMAPDGNGGIYLALHTSGAIKHMTENGIHCVYTGAIDNAVSKVGDPVFIGYCLTKGADVGNKVCTKCGPHEKVGIQCLRDGVPAVVEYSDLDPKIAERRDENGGLVFSAGNVCIHYYTLDFLRTTCLPSNLPSEYHVARKKIPYADEKTGVTVKKCDIKENTGIKLESFIFDIFSKSKNLVVFEVQRADEFSPVKNAPGSASDSPDTARAIISSLHKSWLQKAGVTFTTSSFNHGEDASTLCEISPLVSYAGEGLSCLSGKNFPLPLLVQREGERVNMAEFVKIFNDASAGIEVYTSKKQGQGCDVSGCAML